MAPQQRQYPVLRLDFPAQNAAQLGKADKALQQMGLTVEVPHGGKDRMQRFVGRISQKTGALPQQLDRQAVEAKLLFRKAGEKAPLQKLGGVGRDRPHLPQYPQGVAGIRCDISCRKQRKGKRLIAGNGGGAFFFCVAFKNAAEKAVKATIVKIDHLIHSGATSL